MALNPPSNVPTSTSPVEVFRAALHRVDGVPVWWFHRVVESAPHVAVHAARTVGYAVLLSAWFVADRKHAVSAWLDRSDDAVADRFPRLTGQKRGQS